jgi:multidrug efflux pump
VQILEDFRRELTGFPGVDIEVLVPEGGPPTGKAIQIQFFGSRSGRALTDVARKVAAQLEQIRRA